MLLSILGQVNKQGKEDVERQKQKINQKYADLLDEHRKAAQNDAEKSISQIVKNIQIQNLRLEEEAFMQDQELAYLDNKNTALEIENENAKENEQPQE